MRLFGNKRQLSDFDPVEISEKKGIRYLHLGGPAVQSAMRIKDPYALELEYTRAMMAFLLFNPAPANMALIGLGGGSIAKFIHRNLADSHLTALEINPDVVSAARSYFLLPADDARLQVEVGDGARFVREQDGSLDVLLVDGYDANRIVEDLASADFYDACLRALAPGGIAAFNLWGSDKFFDIYFDRVAKAFADHTLMLPAEKKGNIQLFAFKPPLPHAGFARLLADGRLLEARLGLEMPVFVERMRSFNPSSERGFLV
ncbi:MAG: spermidine synthase [Parasulfuritortus sp.]|jgi:spermidine synthase|nr:spermidine synthase [Parasulfuritortus sp.]